MKKKLFVAVAVVLLCASVAAAENGLMAVGLGARSAGMGGLAIAYPGDSFVIGENPAGLVTIPQLRVDVDFGFHTISRFRLESDKPVGNSTDKSVPFASTKYPLFPNIAGAYSFRSVGIVAGFGFIRVAEQYNDFETARNQDLQSYFRAYRTVGAAAYSLPARWSIGGAVYMDYMETYFQTYLGEKFAEGVFESKEDSESDNGNKISSTSDESTTKDVFIRVPRASGFRSVGLIAGLLWQPFDGLDLGAMVDIPINSVWLSGTRNTDLVAVDKEYKELKTISDLDFQMNMKMPIRGGLGVTVAPIEMVRFGVEGKYIAWSQTMDTIDVRIGGKKDEITLGWRDQVVLSGGLEVVPWSSLAFRVGGNYGTRVVDADYYTHLYNPLQKTHLTGGLGYIVKWSDNVSIPLALSGVYGFTPKYFTGAKKHKISPVFAGADMKSVYTKINLTVSFLYF